MLTSRLSARALQTGLAVGALGLIGCAELDAELATDDSALVTHNGLSGINGLSGNQRPVRREWPVRRATACPA